MVKFEDGGKCCVRMASIDDLKCQEASYDDDSDYFPSQVRRLVIEDDH